MKSEINQEILKKWGIYKITNILTGDFYIGSTIESFKKRIFNKHISDYYLWLNLDKRPMCPILYNAFKKYGIENFKVEVLIYFNSKKSPDRNKRIVLFLEERFIKKLNPKYNVCKNPIRGGCPNLGRKLSKEWRDKIREKSKLYKHTSKPEVYQNKSLQNKNLSAKYRVEKEDVVFEGSAKECANFLNICTPCLHMKVNKEKYKVQCLKTQKKKIQLLIDNEWKIFDSFSECDKYLKMWRGYTSTQVVNKSEKIYGYKYEFL